MSTYLPTVFGENLMDVFDDFYNGPHVKTTSKKILVNGRFVRRWRAALKSSSAKVPLQWATGAVRLFARPNQRSAGWLIGLKTAPEGPIVKGTVDEVFRASVGVVRRWRKSLRQTQPLESRNPAPCGGGRCCTE